MKAKVVSFWVVSTSLFTLVTACGPRDATSAQDVGSSEEAVDMPNTPIKWQSIGNCWSYAFAGWAEGLILQASGQVKDISESYITYRHFEEQILQGTNKVQTGGSFQRAASLTRKYGLMWEGDFIPSEAGKTFSQRQKDAEAYLNRSLTSGALSRSRSATTVRAELDAAFGVNLSSLSSKILKAESIAFPAGRTLAQDMMSWTEVNYPNGYTTSIPESQLPYFSGTFRTSQLSVQRRVMKAMNDRKPVVVNWYVDFNALGSDGVFNFTNLKAKGHGHSGFHSTVLEDYTATGRDASGRTFVVGEGEQPENLKSLAVQYGSISALIVKNSWGGNDRRDRDSYTRNGEKGFHKLNADYAFGFMGMYEENAFRYGITGVNSFILPPGY